MKIEVMLVRALVALAKRELADSNAQREHERDWPAGQSWLDLSGSSQNAFMRAAREESGIPHEAYRDLIQSFSSEVLDETDLIFNG